MSQIPGSLQPWIDSYLITGFLAKTLWLEVDPTNPSQGTKVNGNLTVTDTVKTNNISTYNDPNLKVNANCNLVVNPPMSAGNVVNTTNNVEIRNRNLAICDANGNGPVGYPGITTDPRWGYSPVMIRGDTDMRGILRINRSQNYTSIFNQYGVTLQMTNPDSAIGSDTTIQLGRDFASQNNAAIMAFKYAGNGSPLNTFRIDTNGNQASTTPSFVITMPPPPGLGNVGIHVDQPQYPLDIKGDTVVRNITTGFEIMNVDAANGDLTLRAADNVRMMFLSGNQTAFNIGKGAGVTQGTNSVAIGANSGTTQTTNSIAIGTSCGTNQSNDCIAIGNLAGGTSQAASAIAIGSNAGLDQAINSIAIGVDAGTTTQANNCVAIGRFSGNSVQGSGCIAIGNRCGQISQGIESVAIGDFAAQNNQGQFATAIGYNTANVSQGQGAVAIGSNAGQTSQTTNAVCIGVNSGQTTQGQAAVGIGANAGRTSQGAFSVAIGALAGETSQHANSIVLNSSGGALNTTAASQFLVSSVRTNVTPASSINNQPVFYNFSTKEFTYQQFRVQKPVMLLSVSNFNFPTSGAWTQVVYNTIKFGDSGTTGTGPTGFTNTGIAITQDATGFFTNNSGYAMTLQVSANIDWSNTGTTGVRYIAFRIYNASNVAQTDLALQTAGASSFAGGQHCIQISTSFQLANGFKFSVIGFQTQTTAITGNSEVSITPL